MVMEFSSFYLESIFVTKMVLLGCSNDAKLNYRDGKVTYGEMDRWEKYVKSLDV